MDIYKCPKLISLFTFGKKLEKSLWTKGCILFDAVYVVVTEIILEMTRPYMVTNLEFINNNFFRNLGHNFI
jgi:hypothetical protein